MTGALDSWRNLWAWLFPSESDEVAALRQELALTQSRLDVKTLENELLAELNEELRRWIRANVAAAKHVGDQLGLPALENERQRRP